MRLQDKVAIVTGSASGIGRSTAILFAREGARLVLNDIEENDLEALIPELATKDARSVQGNVADEDVARRLAQEPTSAFGRLRSRWVSDAHSSRSHFIDVAENLLQCVTSPDVFNAFGVFSSDRRGHLGIEDKSRSIGSWLTRINPVSGRFKSSVT